MVLEGPSGSGKSAAVHETARLLGYKVQLIVVVVLLVRRVKRFNILFLLFYM